jgi:8-amino-7-oxononanoate synthase
LEDRLNHASLIDGGLLASAKFQRYRHADRDDLAAKLAKCVGKTLIVSDGVFSMDGDLALLPSLVELANAAQAGLMVDDAHGLGVLGATGGGVLQHYGLTQDDVPILMGTLGKAFGTFGAFVAGSENLIETLIQQARTYIFTTALPAPVAAATRASLKIVMAEVWRRDKLQQLIAHFRQGAKDLALPVLDSPTAIQPLLIGDNFQALAMSEALFAQGFWVGAIRPPTVPKGQARLRITLSAAHEFEQLDRLLAALVGVLC